MLYVNKLRLRYNCFIFNSSNFIIFSPSNISVTNKSTDAPPDYQEPYEESVVFMSDLPVCVLCVK